MSVEAEEAAGNEITLHLTPQQLAFVQTRAAEQDIAAPEYVGGLIAEAQKRQERLEALLLEGIHSGPPIEVDDSYWEAKQRRLEEKYGQAVAGA